MTLSTTELDQALRALADPSRRLFVDRLSESPMSVSELARYTDLTLAAVVQHLQVLEASGLVSTHKTGRVRMCTLNAGGLYRVEEWVAARRRVWERRLDALDGILSDEDAAQSEKHTP